MIMRLFLFLGLLLLGGTAYFVVGQQPPTFQATPVASNVTKLQNEGLLPVGPLAENEEIEHGIFDVPPQDEVMLEAAMENMDMGGGASMDMGGDASMDMADGTTMDMDGDASMDMADGTTMDMDGDGVMDMDMDGDGVMDMSSASMGTTNPVLDMDMDGDGVMDMASASMGTDTPMDMADSGTMDMDDDGISEEESERLMAGRMAGLVITPDGEFDREINFSMSEWTFSDLEIEAQPGERIRFTVRNDGQILHEFMFMSMAGMQAVNYRARRADWSLLEHEALFEQSLLLPGEEITFIAEVLRPGGWMFMCMLPYHMQMGMMGQIATPGMAMDMAMDM